MPGTRAGLHRHREPLHAAATDAGGTPSSPSWSLPQHQTSPATRTTHEAVFDAATSMTALVHCFSTQAYPEPHARPQGPASKLVSAAFASGGAAPASAGNAS